MGIKGLAKLLTDEAPDCVREVPLNSLHGRKIAIDASMSIYQFLIAVRSGNSQNPAMQLTNAEGETTSHIQGFFNRTIRYMVEGIRPVYVFDGKPPNIKSGELAKRKEKREKAEKALKQAQEEGNVDEEDKQQKRLVRAGTKENNDCKKLLSLMGIPVINAPCEAEAQCSALAKSGKVYATATEDMDALTFQTPILLRKMQFASAKNPNIQTINYKKAIEDLNLTHAQFVDLCILMGCDYCDTIKGIGPKTALKLIREHKDIETILQNINRTKYDVPESWVPNENKNKKEAKEESDSDASDDENGAENGATKKADDEDDGEEIVPIYVQARKLFNEHEVLSGDDVELKWKECDVPELTKFLVDDMCFNADRVKSSIEKLQKALKATSKPQARMDSFFAIKPKDPSKNKRKVDDKKKDAKGGKKSKNTGFFGKKKR